MRLTDSSPPISESCPGQSHEQAVARKLHELIDTGIANLPSPGSGQTLQRWRALAGVGAQDLSLAKLFEGHTDALQIRRELDAPPAPSRSSWGMWAAEPPDAKVIFRTENGGASGIAVGGEQSVLLTGRKAWCSGARSVSHGLLTVWRNDGAGPFLASVEMRQAGVNVSSLGWSAIGMAASGSVDVSFSSARAQLLGHAGFYLNRPGFWHGGAGVAACWLGGAQAIAHSLWRTAVKGGSGEANFLRQIALGKVDIALRHTIALMREAAEWIDAQPTADASELALRVRLSAEASADQVMAEAGRALGAAAFCKDADFARMACDLPVYLRQSHAERDCAALGQRVSAHGTDSWSL